MWISVKKSRERPFPNQITLLATRWFKKVGKAELTFHEPDSSYSAYIESYAPGTGVVRELCLKLDPFFQALANSTRREFYHKIHFISEEARQKIQPYLEKYGPALGYEKVGKVWVKRYRPQ